MSLNPEILRASFELVVSRRPDLTVRFYEILFEQHPDLKPMFGRNTGAAQARMLAEALGAVLDHLEDAAWLSDTLGTLGRRHIVYGVTDAMYDQVGGALLATLAEVAGDDWSPVVEAQWTMAYGAIAGLMQAGAKTAAA